MTVGDRVLRVRLRREMDQLLVRVDDGQEQPASLGVVRGALHWLLVGERRTELLASVSDDVVTLAVDGLAYDAEVVDEARARLASVVGARAVSHARRELRAPMPGLLVRVLCQPGERVEASQPLAVLQAMKMENELSLPRGGTVTELKVQPGQTVEQGQVLIVVE
ncbi:MAG TPA: biotin/lipoyl-containing protein [Chloroflexota bacterium]